VADETSFNPENIWKRVGLDELRQALATVDNLTHRFERALQELPRCNQCARIVLLEQIQKTGDSLSGELISLSALAGTLKNTIQIAEKAQKHLAKDVPPACRCEEGECTCHD